MPTLFQGTCGNCGHETPVMLAGYGAVIVDEPVAEPQHEVAGAVLTSEGGGAIATTVDPRFVVLRHPAEDYDLAATGYSWSDLLQQGRYVSVTNVICRECGTVFPRRRLTAPGAAGCMPSLGLGVAVGVAVGCWRRSVFAGLVAWYLVTLGAMILVGSLASLYLRLRFSVRAASLATERVVRRVTLTMRRALAAPSRCCAPHAATKLCGSGWPAFPRVGGGPAAV